MPEPQPYLQWLSLIPEVGPERARAIAEVFPDFERLKAAYFEELVLIPGMDDSIALRILDLVRDRATEPPAPTSASLYLCPECGSFVAEGASSCPSCLAEFLPPEPSAGAEDDVITRALLAPGGAVPMCARCGAFLPSGHVCPICGVAYAEDAIRRLPASSMREPSGDVPPCAICGAFVDADASSCPICTTSVPPRKVPPIEPVMELPTEPAAEPRVGRGVGRDFLSRWKRISEAERAPSGPEVPPEVEHVEPQLQVATTDETKPAPAPPEPEIPEAAPPSPPPQPVRTVREVPPPVERVPAVRDVDQIEQTLLRYDALVQADPSLRAAWETRGDLLARLGRIAEAEESYRRAVEIAGRTERATGPGRTGFRSPAPSLPSGASGAVRRDGRTNGKVNGRGTGRINGIVNGRVNGRVNGLVNGRVNGRVNGLVDRRGAGAMNGEGPRVAAGTGAALGGLGRTNGLINGDGFTNGRIGRRPVVGGVSRERRRAALWIGLVAILMLTVPVFATLLAPEASPAGIAIDGAYGDWAAIVAHPDSATDEPQNADVNLIEYKVAAGLDTVSVYARVAGSLFRGAGSGADAILVLVDSDSDNRTGYALGRFGADEIGEVYGWDGQIYGSTAGRFESFDRHDWRGFRMTGAVEVAANGREIELRFPSANPQSDILVVLVDGLRNVDMGDAIARADSRSLGVAQVGIGPDVITSTAPAPVLRIDLTPSGGPVAVTGLNVSLRGSVSPTAIGLSLYLDRGDGAFDALDAVLGTALGVRDATFPVSLGVTGRVRLFVGAAVASAAPGATVGASLSGVVANATISWGREDPGLSYVGVAPPSVTVDGAFGDWPVVPRSTDPTADVANRTGASPVQNDNVDLVSIGSTYDGVNASFFVAVAGRMLGGGEIPNIRSRTPTTTPGADSDRDTVPDRVEANLSNPDLRYDFNNDNTSDGSQRCDVDQDGISDYGCAPGTDLWLNTTIPSWYPAPYAGRAVSVFVGPLVPETLVPVDAAYVYLDADNDSATGMRFYMGPTAYGIDSAVVTIGRGGVVESSGFYQYTASPPVPFTYVAPALAGIDATRLEIQVPAASVGPNYRAIYYAADWTGSYDLGVPVPPARVAGLRILAIAGNLPVINEVFVRPNPEWIELANPHSLAFSLSGWRIQFQRAGGGWTTMYTFPAGSTIGPWGSGSEYVSVTLATGSLPNAGRPIRLLNAGGTTIDATTYPAMPAGRTWARFKDPLTGKPMDSDNDAADFYVSLLPSRGGPNDRHRPTIAVAKTVSAATPAPGDIITYSIYYNNTGAGRANFVWLNDTLPGGVTYVGSSVAPTSVSGSTYRWTFTNVAPVSANVLTITAQVNLVPDLTPLPNTVTLAYTDQLNRQMAGSQAWGNATVLRPVIAVSKVASVPTAQPGDIVTYTIYYNNTGSVSAHNVVIADTLPMGVTFLSSSIPPFSISGRTYTFDLGTVAVGPHSFTITVQVDPTASGVLVNWAFLNYTTAAGTALGPTSDNAPVAIPEFGAAAPLALVAVLGLAFRTARGRRRGRPDAPAQERGVADSVPDADGR